MNEGKAGRALRAAGKAGDTLECGDLAPLSTVRLGVPWGNGTELELVVKSGIQPPHSKVPDFPLRRQSRIDAEGAEQTVDVTGQLGGGAGRPGGG